jgi:hypothetical protein
MTLYQLSHFCNISRVSARGEEKQKLTRKLSGSIDFLHYIKSYKLAGFNGD